MENQFLANLLGVRGSAVASLASRAHSQALANGSFSEVLADALGGDPPGAAPKGAARSIADVVFSAAGDFASLVEKINSSSTMDERLSWAAEFRDEVIGALRAAGYSASDGGGVDKIVVDGSVYDILRSVKALGVETAVQLHPTGEYGGGGTSTNGWSRPASEIVFTAGREHADLIAKINAGATTEERVRWAAAFREEVIADLRAAGHSATAVGSSDKIVIDGVMYDILGSVKAVGQNTSLQMHRVPGSDGSNFDNPGAAIMSAGAAGIGLLAAINATRDLDERRQLALQLRDMIIEALNAAGFTAGEGQEADKIIVNGITYDFIRRLNFPDEIAGLQALRVGPQLTD